ncbi:MAG: hypothetical protein ACREQV_04405, partial [Candidatus Binatia bacterium]
LWHFSCADVFSCQMHLELPQDTGELWMLHMRRGDFAVAWHLSDAVLRARGALSCDHLPRHLQWIWDGRSLEQKRVLIRCYHGLGDTVQFIRYAPLVKAVAHEVTVLVQAELVPLLGTVEGVDRLLPLETLEDALTYDVDVEIMELAHVFRSTLETIPAKIPYIHSPKAARPARDKLAVGIVWAGGNWDGRRSIPVSLLAPLAHLPEIELHIFQIGPALAERRKWPAVLPQWNDIVTEAALIRALDLMISVDSLPAHLAGALGVPVWTLLHKEADWRWMEQREDSPWYPTMRLFRQQRAGDWDAVIAAVAAELASVSAARGAERVVQAVEVPQSVHDLAGSSGA